MRCNAWVAMPPYYTDQNNNKFVNLGPSTKWMCFIFIYFFVVIVSFWAADEEEEEKKLHSQQIY